jgi:adenylate cyclase
MFQFEGYTLDVARGSLRTADADAHLRPKAFEVLRHLVENAGRLVAKEELIRAVWPHVIVTDEVLTHCVSEVRQAIGDSKQTVIVTVPRRGYRFAAIVSRTAAAPQSAPLTTEAPSAGSDPGTRPPTLLDRPSVGVLPFVNLGGDPQQDYFSDGVTEDIITELSRFSELLVIARNSSFQYKGKAVDIRQVGRELAVRYVLEGSVRRSGDRIRITAQLIDAATGVHRWADRYERELHDVFAVQDEVARAIVATLAAHLNRAEVERALLKPPGAWEAYEYYLRGAEAFRLHMNRRTKASLYDARRLLEHALAADPNYARAVAMLSWTYFHAYIEPMDDAFANPATLDHGFELAETAVHLDARLPQAQAQLGWALLWKGRHDDALAGFERAFALNPNFIDNRFAMALIYAGQPAKAIEVLQANARLDPFQPTVSSFGFIGFANLVLRRYEEAVRLFRECTLRQPNLQSPHLWLACAYAGLGQLDDARAEAAEVLRINPAFTIARWKRLGTVHKSPEEVEHRLEGLHKAGLPEN